MTARETTLGALAAADLGKRVQVGEDEGVLTGVLHDNTGWSTTRFGPMPSTTPVTVYEKEGT